jgi:hypothetical protein
VPSLLAGVAGPDQATVGMAGMAGIVLVCVAPSIATVLWWQRADQDR